MIFEEDPLEGGWYIRMREYWDKGKVKSLRSPVTIPLSKNIVCNFHLTKYCIWILFKVTITSAIRQQQFYIRNYLNQKVKEAIGIHAQNTYQCILMVPRMDPKQLSRKLTGQSNGCYFKNSIINECVS